MVPAADLVSRFESDLGRLIAPGERLGIAVSGGPDSLALLLLAAAARPGQVEAATVDHGLRPESRGEAEMVAGLCERIGVPHFVLSLEWDETPQTGLQEKARDARYAALGRWMVERGLSALATGHHLDDQAETLVMRLNRGSGVRGLAAMRASAPLPGNPGLRLLRPLLGWSRAELERLCADASLEPADDPSNRDERHERVRIRRALSESGWLDRAALGRSAANLAAADEALDWMAEAEWRLRVEQEGEQLHYRPSAAPAEIRRRLVAKAVCLLASEGSGEELRGGELDRLMEKLEAGGTATLRGVRCSGGAEWSFAPAPPRKAF